jgi:ParB-like chromosome segregation protein Spo0J
MQIEEVFVDELIPDQDNARKHTVENIEAIKESLRAFGQQKPIVIGEDNTVIAGNGFLMAAKALGWKTINVVRTTLSGPEATAFAIADNRTAELAQWDMYNLRKSLEDMESSLRMATGFATSEIQGILKQAAGGDVYKPILAPEFAKEMITSKDMHNAHGVFDVAKHEEPRIPITCPRCGGDFEIDRPN